MRVENVAHVWEAYAAKGKPLCIAGKSTLEHPNGISVSIYFTKGGRIKGVTVYDGDADETLATVGKVPKEDA